jgi:hypothetical protein
MLNEFSAAAQSLFSNSTKKRRAATVPTGAEQGAQGGGAGFLSSVMGAAMDLGLASAGSGGIRQQQGRQPAQQLLSPGRGSFMRSASGAGMDAGGYSNGPSYSEQFDEDRINSLDNSLSAAQRYKGFSRYRAKYGNVAMLGSSR